MVGVVSEVEVRAAWCLAATRRQKPNRRRKVPKNAQLGAHNMLSSVVQARRQNIAGPKTSNERQEHLSSLRMF